MAHDAFISYSSVDKAIADATCATLEQAGVRCWIAPRDITPGAEWGAAIINAIDNCRVIVLIFSSNANDSRQIRREVERAVSVGIPLVPVRIEAVAPTESLAYFMSSVHWLDALTPPLEAHLQRLAESIKGLLQIGAAGTAQSSAQPGAAPSPASGLPPMQVAATAAAPAAQATPPDPVSIRGMFREIMNFAYRRNWLQAIGWYLVFFVIAIALSAAAGRIVAINTTSFEEGFELGNKVGQIFVVFYCIAIATLLMWYRPKTGANIALAIAGVVMSAIFLGALSGLIFLAILTTRPALKS